jgi:lactobin A/cerein 7B family class IIb bacteriocin
MEMDVQNAELRALSDSELNDVNGGCAFLGLVICILQHFLKF